MMAIPAASPLLMIYTAEIKSNVISVELFVKCARISQSAVCQAPLAYSCDLSSEYHSSEHYNRSTYSRNKYLGCKKARTNYWCFDFDRVKT
jgi:hypothetical protein